VVIQALASFLQCPILHSGTWRPRRRASDKRKTSGRRRRSHCCERASERAAAWSTDSRVLRRKGVILVSEHTGKAGAASAKTTTFLRRPDTTPSHGTPTLEAGAPLALAQVPTLSFSLALRQRPSSLPLGHRIKMGPRGLGKCNFWLRPYQAFNF
jgi:hypothetical protein